MDTMQILYCSIPAIHHEPTFTSQFVHGSSSHNDSAWPLPIVSIDFFLIGSQAVHDMLPNISIVQEPSIAEQNTNSHSQWWHCPDNDTPEQIQGSHQTYSWNEHIYGVAGHLLLFHSIATHDTSLQHCILHRRCNDAAFFWLCHQMWQKQSIKEDRCSWHYERKVLNGPLESNIPLHLVWDTFLAEECLHRIKNVNPEHSVNCLQHIHSCMSVSQQEHYVWNDSRKSLACILDSSNVRGLWLSFERNAEQFLLDFLSPKLYCRRVLTFSARLRGVDGDPLRPCQHGKIVVAIRKFRVDRACRRRSGKILSSRFVPALAGSEGGLYVDWTGHL